MNYFNCAVPKQSYLLTYGAEVTYDRWQFVVATETGNAGPPGVTVRRLEEAHLQVN